MVSPLLLEVVYDLDGVPGIVCNFADVEAASVVADRVLDLVEVVDLARAGADPLFDNPSLILRVLRLLYSGFGEPVRTECIVVSLGAMSFSLRYRLFGFRNARRISAGFSFRSLRNIIVLFIAPE